IVISSTGTPPSRMASTTFIASSADWARTTGISPTSAIFRRTSALFMPFPSPRDPRRAALHDPFDLGQAGHGGVAGRRHGQSTVRGPALHRPLGALARQEAVDEAG